jgi:hypothetical protein
MRDTVWMWNDSFKLDAELMRPDYILAPEVAAAA